MTPDEKAEYQGAEIEQCQARIVELHAKVKEQKAKVRFYKDAQKNLQQANGPLEIVASSLVLLGKMREDGHLSQEDFSAKFDEIQNVLEAHNRSLEAYNEHLRAKTIVYRIIAYVVVPIVAIAIIWLVWRF